MGVESCITKEMIEEYRQMDTCCVSDAMDRLGLYAGLLGIRCVLDDKKICGLAFTVHYRPCGTEKGTVGDFLDDVEKGEVVVIDNNGRLNCTVWGDLMAIMATRKGIEGTVIDGVCRDLPVIRKLGYPIFTKGRYMVTGKDRVEVDYVNKPVSMSNVQVKPGDLILGDDTGVICVPQEKAAEVLEVAKGIAEKEAMIERYIEEGMPLKEARVRTGYHHLQSRQK
jgi:4-hydroxy-4-methyl-2-oxoglutarate aldolase